MDNIVKTNVGVVRKENQDRAAVFEIENVTLAVLCDGMGGHKGGIHASRITIDTFEKQFKKSLPTDVAEYGEWFSKSLSLSRKNMKNFANGDRDLLDMGTTVTAAIIKDEKIYVFNVGDSRTYIYNGLLHQITVDHNLRNHYIKKFNYSEDEAAQVVGAAALTSALGPTKTTSAEQFQVANDSSVKFIILTSDGIHDYISKPNFEKIIASKHSLEKKSSALIKYAIKGKSSDNLTVVIVEVN